MQKIFIDLEFCEISKVNKKQRKVSRFEIIEIGAVKLNENNEIVDRFRSLVKPKFGTLSKFISQLTHIRNEDLVGAPTFSTCLDYLLDWIGDKEVEIYSWSNTDWKQLQNESRLKEYFDNRLEQLYENWIDFQMVFGKILGVEQQISLINALNGAGITFQGKEHSAVADAENTANLFVLTKDEERFEQQVERILDLMRPTPALTFSMGSLLTTDLLQSLEMA